MKLRMRSALLIGLLAWGVAACQNTGAAPTATSEAVVQTTNTPAMLPTSTTAPVIVNVDDTPAAASSQPTATIAGTGATGTPPAVEEDATPETVEEPTATPAPMAAPLNSISLVPVASGLTSPVYLTHAGDSRLFVVEQAGQIRIIDGSGSLLPTPFLNISDQVGLEANEQGLLSVAFHPDYASNGRFFVNYTDVSGDTTVSEFLVSDDPNRADAGSERVLLQIDQPYVNHNGGLVLFGPDGNLYIGMGDGGSQGDPNGNGQNPNTLLGSLLRINVDGAEPYAVPGDNPFVGSDAGRNEVWAYGLRNPWRFHFDPATDDLFVADVGQSSFEEVSFVPAGTEMPVNFGWNSVEGFSCYVAGCNPDEYWAPVTIYGRDQGCSVTGGAIYRGSQHPTLNGHYFYGDFCFGTIWSLSQQESGWVNS